MISDTDLCRQLGDDLFLLVNTVESPLAEITPLMGGGYPGYAPNAFRLRFSDGRVFKGRRFGRESRAAAVDYVLRHCTEPGTSIRDAFPRVLARSGRAILTEWADGRPFDASVSTPERIRECAALQGQMHNLSVPPDGPFTRSDVVGDWRARLEAGLEDMVAAGALERDEVRCSLEWAVRHLPHSAETGFVHCDFCPENMVLRPSGPICVVDNETLAVDAYDYDLARTWYRWRMSPPQREAYLESYGRYRTPSSFLTHFPFWAIVVLVGSAVYRLLRQRNAAEEPVIRLRALLGSLNGGLKPEQAALYE